MLLPYAHRYSCTDLTKPDPLELVLLHGWGLNSEIWDQLMADLLTQYHVTLIDLPGMGRSPVANNTKTLKQVALAIEPRLPQSFMLMGWSLGALVAMEIAQCFAGRVKGLVSVAMTPCFLQTPAWPLGLNPDALDEFKRWFAEDWQGTLARFLALQCKGSKYQRRHINLLKQLVFLHGLPSAGALALGLDMLSQGDYLNWVSSQSSLPMLFVLGEHDALVSSELAAPLTKLNSRVQVEVMKDGAHLPFLDDPNGFLKIALAWYERQCRGENE